VSGTIYCLIDPGGRTYVKEDARSHAEVAADFGLDENACRQFLFDTDDPEALIGFAAEGHLPKRVLMNLLAAERRPAYARTCAAIEKHYTDECAAKNDPCLESGCAVEGEVCLQPLLQAEDDYHKACAAEWIKLFAIPSNRVEGWRH
jgi:hypothetical protein